MVKELNYVKKGILIAVIVAVIIFLVTFWNPLEEQLMYIFSALGTVISLGICGYEPGVFCAWFFVWLIGIIQIVIIGAIIGLIVGKIKSGGQN